MTGEEKERGKDEGEAAVAMSLGRSVRRRGSLLPPAEMSKIARLQAASRVVEAAGRR